MTKENASDAIALLKSDHRKVEGLFEQFDHACKAERKQALAHEICTELKIHMMIEEELFYPALRGKVDDDALDEAYVEHDGAKVLVNDIEGAAPDEKYYDAKVSVLSEEIKHHVKEEERPGDGLFALAGKTDVDLRALGAQLAARKQELLTLAGSEGLPPAVPCVLKVNATIEAAVR